MMVKNPNLRRPSLWIGIALWSLILVLGLLQAYEEAVRWASPYGLTVIRTLLVPCVAILVFYLLSLRASRHTPVHISGPSLWSQVFFLGLVLVLTYWATMAPLRPNWLIILAVWWLLPSLYFGGTGAVSPTTLLSLGSMVLTMIVFELLLRPFPQLWPGYARMVGSNWRRIHADIPTLEYEARGIDYKINDLGFRGEQPALDQVDIIALGDSFTFGVGSQEPWPVHLSIQLGTGVLNLGMGGTDPPKHVAPLIAFGLPRQPDMVIEAYFEGNDLFTCYQPAKPAGARWGDTLVLPDLIGGVKEMFRFLGRRAEITSELSPDIATSFTRSIGGQQVELTFSPAYAATLMLDHATIVNSENWRIASGSLDRMAELSRAADATFILVYLPDRTHVYWPIIRDDPELLAQLNQDMIYRWDQRLGCLSLVRGRSPGELDAFSSSMDITINAQRDLLHDFAVAQGIPFLDLTLPLQRLAAQGVTLAEPLETHYNDLTNQILAQEIAEFIKALDR